jgi:hypothetical protein
MRNQYRLFIAVVFSLLFTISIVAAVNAHSIAPRPPIDQVTTIQKPDQILRPSVRAAERHDTSPPLRDMQPRSSANTATAIHARSFFPLPQSRSAADTDRAEVDPLLGNQSILQPDAVSALIKLSSFDGLANGCNCSPPDTQGDIGYDPDTGKKYYVQWVNVQYAMWDVTGTPIQVLGPTDGNTLWQGFGGACETQNDGDPITLFDPIAHRWLMSQFAVANPYYQCLAISKTADPTGEWYRYAYRWKNGNNVDTFNDYGKFGVWPDGYYISVNQFDSQPEEGLAVNQPKAVAAWKGAGVAVFERDRMLAGLSADMIYFDLFSVDPNLGGMLPSDLDGPNLPPAGAPNYFMEVDDNGSSDLMRIWKFHADWATPNNSTFGLNGAPNYALTVANFNLLSCNPCVPQPGTAQKLDDLGDRLMYRLAYRNFGDHEALVVNHTVDAGGSRAGIRWYEVRGLSGTPSIYQQGTYAPADSLHRWMGSMAMDHSGNLALGFSVASGSVYPSIRATGRLAGDTLGIMTQGETRIVTGTGSQTDSGGRWGDYSMLSIDPQDDCTFWYSQEYVKTTGAVNWQARISSFRFPGCSFSAGHLAGQITDGVTTNPISNALITASLGPTNSVSTSSNAAGFYNLTTVSGTYSVTARAYGYLPSTVTGVVVNNAVTTTRNFALTPAPLHVVSGTVRDPIAGWPLYARLQISGNPIDPASPNNDLWTDPVSGFYSVTLAEGISYTINATAWVAGYNSASRTFYLSADATQNFSLATDLVACTAPGRQLTGSLQQFETWPPAGWSIVDNIVGTSLNWDLETAYSDSNYTGGSGHAATVDSDANSGVPYDTELRTPSLNLSTFANTQLSYKLNYQDYSFGQETFDVDISTDGGTSWTNLKRYTIDQGSWYSTPGVTENISLAPYASETNVKLRWRYYSIDEFPNDWYAQIDDVQIGAQQCTLSTGGLVVGNTYVTDTLITLPVPGAQVSNDSGRSAVSTSTLDPKTDDSFYTLFSPAGSHTFTATTWNQQSVATPNVIMSDTLRLDFYLSVAEIKQVYLPTVLKNF